MLKTSIFKLQVNCPGCNTLHALTGLHEKETCQNCGKVIPLFDFFRQHLFGGPETIKYMNGFLSGTIQKIGGGSVGQAGAYKMTYSSKAAYCEECEKYADEKNIMDAIKNKKPYKCPACGNIMPVKPADYYMKQVHPKIIGILNDSEGADSMEKVIEEKKAMVVFSCMTCGAGLQLSEDTGRMIKCPYCNNENYLPDAIWTKLHPDKEVDPFFVILDLDGSDMKDSLDYFTSGPMMEIYEKHFLNFIKEYFENPFVNDSFNAWLKVFLSAKNDKKNNFGLSIDELQKYFYEQLAFGVENQNPALKNVVAAYAVSIPTDLQMKLAKDSDENIRLALSKNPNINKETVKLLQNDSSPLVATEAKKHKAGLFKSLFG